MAYFATVASFVLAVAVSAMNQGGKNFIEAKEDYSIVGTPVTLTVFNLNNKPVAKWERKFDGSFIVSETLIDISSGRTIKTWTFDANGRREQEKMWVCLDGNGNWVRDKNGHPLLVKMPQVQQVVETRVLYEGYNPTIPSGKTSKIYPCKNCQQETGGKCSFVY